MGLGGIDWSKFTRYTPLWKTNYDVSSWYPSTIFKRLSHYDACRSCAYAYKRSDGTYLCKRGEGDCKHEELKCSYRGTKYVFRERQNVV